MIGLGIDTGGTYTDAVIYDMEKGEILASGKTLTSKGDLKVGIKNTLMELPEDLMRKCGMIALSTTLATNAAVEGRDEPPLPPLSERIDTAVGQIEALAAFSGERIACLEARHHLPWYLHGVPHSAYYRNQLVHVETLRDVEAVVKDIKRDLK